jgi:site-specific recombinase XerD
MPRRSTPPKPSPAPADWTEALARFDAWLVEHERSDHTREDYREDLLAFASWYESKYQEKPMFALLQPAELREWKTHMIEDRKYQPATANRKLAALSSFLRWAEREGHAPEVRTPRQVRRVQPPPRWLDVREQRALLRAAGRHGGSREAAMIRLLMHTGLRVEEACDLTWESIEIRERSGKVTVVGKGRKQRSIPLNSEARAALDELRQCLRRGLESRTGPVLHGQRGPLTPRGVQSILAKLRKHCGLPELSPHALRHTFGHNLAVAGTPIQVIADLMGHESLETTRRYVQPGQDDLAAAVERLAGGED